MFDWLNDNSAAVQAVATVVLATVTLVYVVSAAKQASASTKMAQEMREQRMALDRPNLLIFWVETIPENLIYVGGEASEEELVHFPSELRFDVYNDGPGPAKMLSAGCGDFLSGLSAATTCYPRIGGNAFSRGTAYHRPSQRCSTVMLTANPPRAMQ